MDVYLSEHGVLTLTYNGITVRISNQNVEVFGGENVRISHAKNIRAIYVEHVKIEGVKRYNTGVEIKAYAEGEPSPIIKERR